MLHLFAYRKSDDWPQELSDDQIMKDTEESSDEIEIKIIGKEMPSETFLGEDAEIPEVKTKNGAVAISYKTLGKNLLPLGGIGVHISACFLSSSTQEHFLMDEI